MPEIEFVNAEEALLFERIVKNEEERKLMRKAAWVASEGVQAGLDALAPGRDRVRGVRAPSWAGCTSSARKATASTRS